MLALTSGRLYLACQLPVVATRIEGHEAVVPIITLLVSLVLAAPATAQDDKVYAPPGNSGIEEYLEVVPGAGGDQPAGGDKGGTATAPTPAAALGADNAQKLEALGPDGEAAAAAAAAGSPTDATTARQRHKSEPLGGASNGESIAAQGGGDPVSSVARALGGDGGGMGLLFPILLGLTLILALSLAIARKLRRG